MKFLSFLKKTGHLLKETFREFIANDAIRLSAALSCYILFSLTPLLILVIALCGVFFGDRAVRGEVFDHINGLVGDHAALEIQNTIKSIKFTGGNTFVTISGIIISIIAASGVFAEIQSAINHLWGIKTKPKRNIIKFVMNRLMSFIMIGSTGILLLVGLILNALMDVLNKSLIVYLPDVNVNLFYAINILILFLLVLVLFIAIFKILPDGKIAWPDCIIGSAFTAVLFMIGKFAIGSYFKAFATSSIYGAAATLLFVLTWIYYTSMIFYFGTEFTKVYAMIHGRKIVPNHYSIHIKRRKLK
jgi:membrane protein